MVFQKAKTPTGASGGVLGDVQGLAASDTREIAPLFSEIQHDLIVRRTRLTPAVARVVTELCFDQSAA